jgi:hypothetical protein
VSAIPSIHTDQANETEHSETGELLAAARALGRDIIVLQCRAVPDFETAFVTMVERQARGLVVSAFPLAFNNRIKILTLAAHHKIPTIYPKPIRLWRRLDELQFGWHFSPSRRPICIDSFLAEQCRSRTRWTCVSG